MTITPFPVGEETIVKELWNLLETTLCEEIVIDNNNGSLGGPEIK